MFVSGAVWPNHRAVFTWSKMAWVAASSDFRQHFLQKLSILFNICGSGGSQTALLDLSVVVLGWAPASGCRSKVVGFSPRFLVPYADVVCRCPLVLRPHNCFLMQEQPWIRKKPSGSSRCLAHSSSGLIISVPLLLSWKRPVCSVPPALWINEASRFQSLHLLYCWGCGLVSFCLLGLVLILPSQPLNRPRGHFVGLQTGTENQTHFLWEVLLQSAGQHFQPWAWHWNSCSKIQIQELFKWLYFEGVACTHTPLKPLGAAGAKDLWKSNLLWLRQLILGPQVWKYLCFELWKWSRLYLGQVCSN